MSSRLPESVSVSIVIATCDRPDDLRRCLRGVQHLGSSRSIDVIVVDNRPHSGRTAPAVAEFPEVVLITEPRPGVAYARNAGILAARGAIIVTIDDDVSVPPDWLEKLIAPLARRDVMVVTGNVLPLELATSAQRLFEAYGGLGRGSVGFEMNGDSFRNALLPVPVWKLGGTANAAFRASIFDDPAIGLMEETLGPGMPSGVGEDIYLFFKVLRAGHTIVYEPEARVWHSHRRALADVRRQIYGYSKGFVSFQLTTLWRDRDARALIALLASLPVHRLRQLIAVVSRRQPELLRLMLTEIAGNLAGPWGLWRSCRRVKLQGRSARRTSARAHDGGA
jgi:O-antigen biosynthesis protein